MAPASQLIGLTDFRQGIDPKLKHSVDGTTDFPFGVGELPSWTTDLPSWVAAIPSWITGDLPLSPAELSWRAAGFSHRGANLPWWPTDFTLGMAEPLPSNDLSREGMLVSDWTANATSTRPLTVISSSPSTVIEYRILGAWSRYLMTRLVDLTMRPVSPVKSMKRQAVTQAVLMVQDLIPHNAPAPAVVPTEEGNIELEWRKAKLHIQIEFSGVESYVWIRDLSTKTMRQGSVASLRSEIAEAFDRMILP